MELWTEEFRPKKFEDVVGLGDEIPNAVKQGNTMHLLLFGPAGTGKTTTAKIIIKELGAEKDSLVLNSSNERGIEVIREKVNNFAMTKSSYGGVKLIFLDESDGLTNAAQDSLKNLMETYASNCKFILTANNYNKIRDPIKSRCSEFKFHLPKKVDIQKRLRFVCDCKNITITDEVLLMLINKFYPDIRKCINVLQKISFTTKNITEKEVAEEKVFVIEIMKIMKTKKFTEVRQWMLDENINYEEVIKELNNYIYFNLRECKMIFTNLTEVFKYIVICNRNINNVAWQEIEFEEMIKKLQGLIRKQD